jgi:hypothetical protein
MSLCRCGCRQLEGAGWDTPEGLATAATIRLERAIGPSSRSSQAPARTTDRTTARKPLGGANLLEKQMQAAQPPAHLGTIGGARWAQDQLNDADARVERARDAYNDARFIGGRALEDPSAAQHLTPDERQNKRIIEGLKETLRLSIEARDRVKVVADEAEARYSALQDPYLNMPRITHPDDLWITGERKDGRRTTEPAVTRRDDWRSREINILSA